ncbi:hypothetical protein [Sinanaerobacter chloroacetimidivorans]|uniref:Uncharacterized protein n=1 Tax=Sinanaerobacter chloroacetimidivorans TaxID=2818044 RepID=A0A8J7VXJ2_9FIRM|nr:hypothetical protein [Sinanaerobacter chloroacetimidivorans]MBR0596912.1 hypothetical protein [Sinanaerobacter chloroacetimidivorans]
MGLHNNKHNNNGGTEDFAEDMFETILYYAKENNKAFRKNIARDYHVTLFVTFFLIYGIDLVNYFLLNKYGENNKEVSAKLFSLMNERIHYSFSKEEAELLNDCISVMEDKILEALTLPFEDAVNNPFYELSVYIPSIIDIRDHYDKQYANMLLFNCLGETFSGIGKIVAERKLT